MACRHGRLEILQADILIEAVLPKLSPSDKGRLASTCKLLRRIICRSITTLNCTCMDLFLGCNNIERAAATFSNSSIELDVALLYFRVESHASRLACLLRAFAPNLKALSLILGLEGQLQNTECESIMHGCLRELDVSEWDMHGSLTENTRSSPQLCFAGSNSTDQPEV